MTVEKCVQIADEAIKTLKIPDEMMDISFMYKCREALEKQVPMKPDVWNSTRQCKSCGNILRDANFLKPYCMDCGQKLEW